MEVPSELPEPTLGINFARDQMPEEDWLALVAVHSDAWLLSVAFYFGSRFGKADRERLFNMINDLPTKFEVVAGAPKKQLKERSAVSNHSSNKSKGIYPKVEVKDEEDGLAEEQGDTLCGACGENYDLEDFWICCYICKRWFHGKCMKITSVMAEQIKQCKCPSCSSNKPLK